MTKSIKKLRVIKGKKLAATIKDVVAALPKIRAALPITPLTHSPFLSELVGKEIYFKWDNKLRTGSFKERGVVNFLASLNLKESRRGVCAGSAGNHALALSYHAAKLKIPCHLVMPVSAPLVKVQAAKRTGAEVILEGDSFNAANEHAQLLSKKNNWIYVPGFDHPQIIAGQGTAGLEILDQLDDFDCVVCPVGGGGLIAGVALAIKATKPKTYVIGVQSDWVAKASGAPKRQAAPAIPALSIADGIAVKYLGSLTKPIIEQYVDKMVSLSENDIAKAIIRFLETEKTVVEGAGAAGLGAVLANHIPPGCKKVVVMACGSNIDVNILSRLIQHDMAERGRLLKFCASVPDRPGALHATTGIIAETRANVLEVIHDRSFSQEPGNVDITFLVEVRDDQHREELLDALRKAGIKSVEQHQT